MSKELIHFLEEYDITLIGKETHLFSPFTHHRFIDWAL